MKVLFLTNLIEDYLSDSLLHGFRQIYGENVVDFPKKKCMYISYPLDQKVYGNGFTLYRTLDDIYINREDIDKKIQNNYFDLVIFSDIQRQHKLYIKYFPFLDKKNTIILDGEDNCSIFPYKTIFLRKYWKIKRPHKSFLYFKRELTEKSIKSIFYNLVPSFITKAFDLSQHIKSISFSIPEEKIVTAPPTKNKDFPSHIVDAEIANKIDLSIKYAFDKEEDYYKDLQNSRFGITMKRGGWDCLRHYEIAANGAVICFKNIDKKHHACAPHGLNETNCISYSDYNDLKSKIKCLSEDGYKVLQENAIEWAKMNTTTNHAKEIIKIFKDFNYQVSN